MTDIKKIWMSVLGLCASAIALGQTPPLPPPGFTVDREKKEILIPCRMAPRKLASLPEIYPIEVVATYPTPRGQKAHETVVNFDVKPSDVHKALESLGLKAGKPARGEDGVATGAELDILLEVTDKAGTKRRVSVENVLVDRKTGKPFPPLKWHFTGSSKKQVDPSKPDLSYSADMAGTLIGIYPVTDELVVQTNLTMHEEGAIKIEIGPGLLPPEGTPVLLVIRPAAPRPAQPPLVVVPARVAAEAAVAELVHRTALVPARPAAVAITGMTSPRVADPFQHRKDVIPDHATCAEARSMAIPLPPIPRDSPSPK
jgi:hypothetical protein